MLYCLRTENELFNNSTKRCLKFKSKKRRKKSEMVTTSPMLATTRSTTHKSPIAETLSSSSFSPLYFFSLCFVRFLVFVILCTRINYVSVLCMPGDSMLTILKKSKTIKFFLLVTIVTWQSVISGSYR